MTVESGNAHGSPTGSPSGAPPAGDDLRAFRAEVAEWLEAFGAPRPASPQPPQAEGLPPEAVQEWLDYFSEGE